MQRGALKNILLFLYLYAGRSVSWLPAPLLNLVRPCVELTFQVLSFGRTSAIEERMALALGPQQARAVRRRFVSCVVRRALDELVLERGREKIHCRSFVGREHLDEALAAGRGVLLAGLHTQSGRVARRYLRDTGYPYLSIRDVWSPPLATSRLAPLLAARYAAFFRAVNGVDEVFANDRERSLKMLARLRRNGIVSILIDSGSPEHSVELPFLGRTGRFPAGVFSLARAARCPILPIFSRGGMQSLEIEIGPPLPLDRTLPAAEFWRAHLPALVGILEAQVLAHPEEFDWVSGSDREERRRQTPQRR